MLPKLLRPALGHVHPQWLAGLAPRRSWGLHSTPRAERLFAQPEKVRMRRQRRSKPKINKSVKLSFYKVVAEHALPSFPSNTNISLVFFSFLLN